MRDIFTLFLHAIVIVIRLGCRWRWKKGPKQRWSGYFSLCPFPSWKGVFSQNGPQRSRARRCCAAKRTLHGEDRSEILDKRERGGPKWTAKMAQSLTASDKMGTRYARQLIPIPGRVMIFSISFAVRVGRFCFLAFTTGSLMNARTEV